MKIPAMISTFLMASTSLFTLSSSYAAQIPNPASAFCASSKGKLELVSIEGKGQVGVCTFGKAVIEEWTLFKAKKSDEMPQAVGAFFGTDIDVSSTASITAADYCVEKGGKPRIAKKIPSGEEVRLCEFLDSVIGEQTLYLGVEHRDNRQLQEVLINH
jgi:putative hemolysin